MDATRLPKFDVPFPLARGTRNAIPEYEVVLQDETGEVYQQRYLCPWSTDKDFVTTESIAQACAAQAFISQGRAKRFIGISAQLCK